MYNGKVGSLRRFKDAVKKVDSGEECGIDGDPEWPDFKEGDIIECFDLVERKQTLESASETLKEQVKEYRSKDEERAAKAAAGLEKYQRKRRGATHLPPQLNKHKLSNTISIKHVIIRLTTSKNNIRVS